jgi:hypothetical protein
VPASLTWLLANAFVKEISAAHSKGMTPFLLFNWRFVAIDDNPELVRLRGIGHPRHGNGRRRTNSVP